MESTQIHIVNGESAGGTLRLALGCGAESILVQHDLLSVGPLPRVKSLDEWRTLRGAFWERLDPGGRLEYYDRDLLLHADQLRMCEAMTVWVGGGASDQLLLLWVVQLFALLDTPICKMSLVQIEQLSTKSFDVLSIGELSPDQLKTYYQPTPVSQDGIAELKAFWSALTAPRPNELLHSIGRDATAFPLVRRALRTTLDRFPAVTTGLNHWDHELLNYVRSYGPKVVDVIGHLFGNSMRTNYPDVVGDLYLFARLRQLADPQLTQPAVMMNGDMSSYRGCEVRLTAAGEAFLEGERNFVEVNGTDEWVAGVHLDSKTGDVWYRDGETLVRGSAG